MFWAIPWDDPHRMIPGVSGALPSQPRTARWMFAPCALCPFFKSPSLVVTDAINPTIKWMSKAEMEPHTTCLFQRRQRRERLSPSERNDPRKRISETRHTAAAAKMTRRAKNRPDFTLRSFGATRALREVCPKHRNIRRENLRVRCPRTAWQWKLFFAGRWQGEVVSGHVYRSMLVPEAMSLA